MQTATVLTIGGVSMLMTTPQACQIMAQLDDVVFVEGSLGHYTECLPPEQLPSITQVNRKDVYIEPHQESPYVG